MKIVKPKAKCKGCGHWRVMVHCNAVLVNGCDSYWCLMCWSDHSKIHSDEWDQMSDSAKDELIKKQINHA